MLTLLGSIYGKVADVRNHLYERGVLETFDLGARTISIGNITTGGTGKTPLVAYVAKILASRGEKVCILTRGYGRINPNLRILVSDGENILATAPDSGDEPYELAQKLLGKAIVIADADRVAAAEWAKRKFGVTAFVLDDGFQHRRAKRDVDIVCIDATNPFDGGKLLPAGHLREPLNNLMRADIIIITRANLIKEIEHIKSEISNLSKNAPIFFSNNTISHLKTLEEFYVKTQRTQRQEISEPGFAFCGLGNPENFFEMLLRHDLSLAGTRAFRDHHFYTQADISDVENQAHKNGAGILLTTSKDAVKLKDLQFKIPCYVAGIEVVIDDADAFAALL